MKDKGKKLYYLLKDFQDKYPEIKICYCNCHIYGVNYLHVKPCCDLWCSEYIYPDGKVDKDKLTEYIEDWYASNDLKFEGIV